MPNTSKINSILRTTCALAILGITPAFALESINQNVPNAAKVGEGRMKVLMWDVYDATLFAPEGAWDDEKPYALQLSYLRNLIGKKIADRSIEEIRGQGFDDEIKLATWHTQLRNIFPDVKEGESITGVYTNDGATIFYKDDTKIGEINDPEFSKAFFNIWLSDKTSAPDLRKRLLGSV